MERVGPYHIERELGRGGMGVVYLAHDSRLERRVAIKALPEHVALDPERLARFEREARALAALNHPNVAGIYGVEEHEGHRYLILEYVEGQTLAERLDRGPIPADEAIEYAIEIAAGIEAAHESGVIHRDLKPDNIKITSEGKIKVLDFGLAKSSETSATSSSSQIATLSTPHSPTVAGAILGTAPYMSPEQARGRHVDKRTDIWSFGIILYEMLTGSNPFRGETATDSIGAIMHKDIDLGRLPGETPPSVHHVLSRCLERDRNLRYRDIGDVRVDLQRQETPHRAAASKDRHSGARRGLIIAGAVALGLLLGAALMLALRPASLPSRPVVASVLTPKGVALNLGMANPGVPAISPDGRWIVYTGRDSRREVWLYLVELATGTTRRLEGTQHAQYPFWSPSSDSIGYFNQLGLSRIETAGGPPRTLDPHANNGKGGAWSADDWIIYTPGPSAPLFTINASGGERIALTTLDDLSSFLSHRIPWLLPRGDAFIYVRRSTATVSDGADGEIWARTLDGSVDHLLVKSMGSAQYHDGYLLYVVNGVLVARPFDERTLQFTGEAVRLADNVLVMTGATLSAFSVSPSGILLYVSSEAAIQNSRLQWRKRDGQRLDVVQENVDISALRLIGDGSRVLLNKWDIRSNELSRIVLDFASGRERRLDESSPHAGLLPVSHDGKLYAHTRREKDETLILVQPVDSFAEPQVVGRVPSQNSNPWIMGWSPDDKALFVRTEFAFTDGKILQMSIEDGVSTPTAFSNEVLVFEYSPDNQWIAYEAPVRNERHIFICPADRPNAAVRVSENAGRRPRWRGDGRELFFHADDGGIYCVRVERTEQGAPTFSPPELLFDAGRSPAFSFDSAYDVASDGSKFIIIEPMSDRDFGVITLMTNWKATMRNAGARP